MMYTLKVDLAERSYPIYIGEGVLRERHWIDAFGKDVMVVTNETVAPLYLSWLLNLLEGAGKEPAHIILPDGESYKTLDTVELIFDALLELGASRQITLLALGGGVIGDMTGFAAACYQRGVDFVQVPTTLLSQVDSSVGGKTGVNHPLGKNMIGAFHQPQVVVADLETLKTLPDRELSAGLAEVIKYGLIADAEFYQWLETNMAGLLTRKPNLLAEAVYRSCQCKAKVVAEDEREGGIRAILNLGHTFGHAIESCLGYGKWLHGEAVAYGMLMALDLSVRVGGIPESEVGRLRNLLKVAGLPTTSPDGMTEDDYLGYMARDKKVKDGTIRLVLLDSVGHAVVSSDYGQGALKDTLSAAVSGRL